MLEVRGFESPPPKKKCPIKTHIDGFKGPIDKIGSSRKSLSDLPAKNFFGMRFGILVGDVFVDGDVERFVIIVCDSAFDELGVGQQSKPVRDVA